MGSVSSIERGAAALDARRKKPGGPGDGGYSAEGERLIRLDPGRLPAILDEFGAALADANDLNLFVHAGRLVRLYQAPDGKATTVHRPKGALVLHQVDAAHLAEIGSRAARFQKFDGRAGDYKFTDCPRRIAEAYLARGHWPELRHLEGFVEGPIATPIGILRDVPGFDPETGLFFAFMEIPGYSRPAIPVARSESERAMDALLAAVQTFPFVDWADRSAALAGMLTALLRRILPAAPMFAVTAPTPGTGKTLLADTFSIIATGRRGSVLSLGHDESETEKRLAGVLLAGDAVILWDNIERSLSGDLFCQVLTQPWVRLRPLGGSGMVSVPTAALMVATGNNLAVVGDLKRRVALIRLDAKAERPEQRTFERNHLEAVFENRGELIAAALSIPLGYLGAGAPQVDGLAPIGGFEQWDLMVRRPLVWLGLPDPLIASECLREQDPDLEAMRQMFTAWSDLFGTADKTVAEIVAAGMDSYMGPGQSGPVHPELRDALQVVCREKPTGVRLGYWLRSHRDRIVDGLQLVQSGRDNKLKQACWRVAQC